MFHFSLPGLAFCLVWHLNFFFLLKYSKNNLCPVLNQYSAGFNNLHIVIKVICFVCFHFTRSCFFLSTQWFKRRNFQQQMSIPWFWDVILRQFEEQRVVDRSGSGEYFSWIDSYFQSWFCKHCHKMCDSGSSVGLPVGGGRFGSCRCADNVWRQHTKTHWTLSFSGKHALAVILLSTLLITTKIF